MNLLTIILFLTKKKINNKLTKKTCYNYINFYCRFSLENGYRHIDCAKVYLNEKEVGQVFNDYIGKSIAREDLFIIGKVIFIEVSDCTLPTAEILSGKNARAWVSIVSYLKK